MRKSTKGVFYGFVKKVYVNGGLLPTYSLIAPCLVLAIFFCTFADVEECPCRNRPRRPRVAAKVSTKTFFFLWQNLNQVVLVHFCAVA
jgi:hypothetical protein